MIIFRKQYFHIKALRMLVATNALILVAAAMLAPIQAIFVEKIGGNILDAGFAMAIFSLSAAVTVLLSGRMADKYKRPDLVVMLGYIIMGIGFLLFLFASSVWFLFVIQIILGIGEAIYSPAFDAMYSKHLDKKNAGSQWSNWEAMNYLTVTGGAAVGGLIADHFGFDALFIVMVLLAFFSALYMIVLGKKSLL
ncbi:MAG: MFS transporter [Patescibacteria group bacterium]